MPIWIPLERGNHREQAQLSGKSPCLHPWGHAEEFCLIVIGIKAKELSSPCSPWIQLRDLLWDAVLPCAGACCV